jgi:endo-1,3-1,4-beta-glycanase ExoK
MSSNRLLAAAFASTLFAGCGASLAPSGVTSSGALRTPVSSIGPNLNLSNWNDTSLWQRQNGYTNGGDFDVGWRADHATVSGSILDITLDNKPCPAGCSKQPYASDELDSVPRYRYGTYTVRMRTAKSSGVVSTFFTYINLTPNGKETNDEIDVEIPGARTRTLETTYYKEGGRGIEHTIQLPFDSSQAMHTYAIQWLPNSISWIVDGHPLYTAHGSPATMPTHPSYFILNFWTGDTPGMVQWLGPFHYTHPLHALYGSASFEPAKI